MITQLYIKSRYTNSARIRAAEKRDVKYKTAERTRIKSDKGFIRVFICEAVVLSSNFYFFYSFHMPSVTLLEKLGVVERLYV